MVACAAIQGSVALPSTSPPADYPGDPKDWKPAPLHSCPHDRITKEFHQAWDQIVLPANKGGHGLRRWADYQHQAFVGQWSLTVQSAQRPREQGGGSWFPVLWDVIDQAARLNEDQADARMYGWSAMTFEKHWLQRIGVTQARARAALLTEGVRSRQQAACEVPWGPGVETVSIQYAA